MQEQAKTIERERRYIYNGDSRPSTAAFAVRPNRQGTHRRVSTFNIILALFAFGGAIVFYVNNIITVNQLAYEVGQLQTRYDAIKNVNDMLRTEVNRKAALERIGSIATEQLQLRYPSQQPVLLDVDAGKLEAYRQP